MRWLETSLLVAAMASVGATSVAGVAAAEPRQSRFRRLQTVGCEDHLEEMECMSADDGCSWDGMQCGDDLGMGGACEDHLEEMECMSADGCSWDGIQ
jgi:hypothetical protein